MNMISSTVSNSELINESTQKGETNQNNNDKSRFMMGLFTHPEMQDKQIENTGSNKTQYATLLRKCELQPRESKFIKVKCPEEIDMHQTIGIKATQNKTGAMMDNMVGKANNRAEIDVKITNGSSKVITLNKGMKIGKIILNAEDLDCDKIDNEKQDPVLNTLTVNNVKELRQQEFDVEDFKMEHLPSNLQNKIMEILENNACAFSKSYKTLGQTSMVTPKFDLLHDFPLQVKPYKTPHYVKEYATEEINQLLEADIIEKTNSNYAFPVIYVKKKSSQSDKPQNAKYRMAVDYRLLNPILEQTPYMIPDIKDILHSISGKKLYTVLDFNSAFYQINLRPEDRHKLAFVTEQGHFQPKRLSFGTKISTLVFAELIDKVLGHFNKNNIQYFVDDILIAADNEQEMLNLLEQVLQTLSKHNLTIDPRKMQLFQTDIEFLGYKINESGYSPSDRNITKVINLQRPRTKKAVKQFIGFLNYFKNQIYRYSEIIHPLLELTKQDNKFKWTEKEETAFQTIKAQIISNPTLKPPDHSKEFYLITDASKLATSAILAQKIEGEFYPIEFYGRKLKESEKNYSSSKMELLALHDSLLKFRHLLLGKRINVLTDSKALTYYTDLEKKPDVIVRWLLDLQEFDINIAHIKGTDNPADYISRHVFTMDGINILEENLFNVNPLLSQENITKEQNEDSRLNKIIETLKARPHSKMHKKYKLLNDETLVIKNRDNDYANPIFLAPTSMRNTIMETAHAPHFSFSKTYLKIKERFHWIGMYQSIKFFCAKCDRCNRFKSRRTIKVPINKMRKDYASGEALHIDIVGKLPTSLQRNNYILTVVDTFSRFLQAIPLRDTKTSTILRVLNQYFGTFGLPKYINLDNASYFQSFEFKNYMQNLNITLRYSSVYKPTANAIAERLHRTLKGSIAAMCEQIYQWETRLIFFVLNYNDSRHRATGFKPAFLFFGRHIRTPFTNYSEPVMASYTGYTTQMRNHCKEVRKIALQNMQKTMQEYDVINQNTKPKELKIGDLVYLKQFTRQNTFQEKFTGPYQIQRVFRNKNYLIKPLKEGLRSIKIHISKLFVVPNDNNQTTSEQ